MSNLDHAIAAYAALKDRLLAEFPELAEDETALMDTLEGESDLDRALVAVFESAEMDKLMASALQDRMDTMQERYARFQARHKAKRDAIARAMEAVGLKKIEAPEVTLSLRNLPPSLLITDETAIPAEYWREKVSRSVDRSALKDALNDNKAIPGAVLSNGGCSLSARTK